MMGVAQQNRTKHIHNSGIHLQLHTYSQHKRVPITSTLKLDIAIPKIKIEKHNTYDIIASLSLNAWYR